MRIVEGRTEYAAVGTVGNLAARVCAIAPGGAVLVINRVHTAVEDRVAASSLGEHDLKGISRPVPLYQIDGMR